LWVGSEFMGAVRPMYVNILAVAPGLAFAATGGISSAYAKIKTPTYVTLSCAIGNVFISLYCAIKLGWGLVGFAFGTMVASFVEDMIFSPYYACKIARIEYRRFYFNSFVRPLILCGIFGILLFYLKFYLKIPMVYVIGCIIISFPAYIFLGHSLVLNPYERSKLKELIFKIIAFVRRGK
jgi:hypothetical protein